MLVTERQLIAPHSEGAGNADGRPAVVQDEFEIAVPLRRHGATDLGAGAIADEELAGLAVAAVHAGDHVHVVPVPGARIGQLHDEVGRAQRIERIAQSIRRFVGVHVEADDLGLRDDSGGARAVAIWHDDVETAVADRAELGEVAAVVRRLALPLDRRLRAEQDDRRRRRDACGRLGFDLRRARPAVDDNLLEREGAGKVDVAPLRKDAERKRDMRRDALRVALAEFDAVEADGGFAGRQDDRDLLRARRSKVDLDPILSAVAEIDQARRRAAAVFRREDEGDAVDVAAARAPVAVIDQSRDEAGRARPGRSGR